MSYEDCACVGGCENCEQLDYAAIVGNAKRFERERIIKLLDEMLADNWDWAADCDCEGCLRINKMFALIKGENK